MYNSCVVLVLPFHVFQVGKKRSRTKMPRRYGSPPRDQADRNPPLHNRLFILGGKEAEEEEFRSAFSKYGTVQDVWIVKNRQTGEKKGKIHCTKSHSTVHYAAVCIRSHKTATVWIMLKVKKS